MNYLDNIKKLYIRVFFHNLIFAYVIERLFWEQRGMTVLMVVYTEIIYAVTVMLLEIPTGILADKWSRKKMMIIGDFLTLCSSPLILFANNFWHFAFLVFIAGISTSMCSGSENALLYDSLTKAGQEHKFEKVLGRLKAFDFSAALIAAFLGGILANVFNYEFNYWISIISCFIAFLASLSLIDIDIKSVTDERVSLKSYVIESLQVFKDNPNITLVILSGMFLGASMTYLDEFWQIYLKGINIPIYAFGVFGAMGTFARIPGGLVVSKLLKKFNYFQLLCFNFFMTIIGFTIMAVYKSPLSILAMIAVNFGVGIVDPIVSGYLHHRIDSGKRATLDSFQSLGLRAFTILVGLGFGYASRYSIFKGFGFLGIICLAYFICFAIANKKVKI